LLEVAHSLGVKPTTFRMARIVCQSAYAAAAKDEIDAPADNPSDSVVPSLGQTWEMQCQALTFRPSVGSWLLPKAVCQSTDVATPQEADAPALSTMPTLPLSVTQPPQYWNFHPSVGTWMLPRTHLQIQHPSPATIVSRCESALEEENPSNSTMKSFGVSCWNMRQSVSTWLLPQYQLRGFHKESGAAAGHDISTEQQAELEIRWAGFDLFWYKLDEAAEDEKFSYMAAELEIRQQAFVFFWQQLDAAAEDEMFAYMAAELEIRQDASNFSWQQLDEAEENVKFASMIAELEIRQTALDTFWQQIDAATQGQQAVTETATAELSSSNTYSFIMAGSPAKSLRKLAKDSATASAVRLDIDETWSSKLSAYLKLPLDVSGSQDAPKSGCRMSRSASTSAMALDLGLDRQPNNNSIRMPMSPASTRSSSLTLRPVKATGLRKSGRERLEKNKLGTIQLSPHTELRGWDMSLSLRRV